MTTDADRSNADSTDPGSTGSRNTVPGSTARLKTSGLTADERAPVVRQVFDAVASRYDLMNDLMSGGLHRAWKSAMIEWLAPPSGPRPYEVLDIAGGTGDIATRIIERSGPRAHVTVCDINAAMTAAGKARIASAGFSRRIGFITGDAEALPAPDAAFDACTIAFGIRNVGHKDKALKEACRVLRPGGRFLCLEFSTVTMPLLDRVYEAYSQNLIPAMGRAIVGEAEPYRYLVDSIAEFPKPEEFAGMIRAAGFSRVSYRALSGGIVAIHSGWRL